MCIRDSSNIQSLLYFKTNKHDERLKHTERGRQKTISDTQIAGVTLIDCCCRKLPAVHHSTSRPLARGAITSTSTSINADNTRLLQAEDRAARVHRLSNVITCRAGLHTKRGVWRESRTCTDSVSRRVNINSRVPARQSPALFPHHFPRFSGAFQPSNYIIPTSLSYRSG